MYIAPNSTIRIFDDIPLDNSYENTIYFPSRGEQNQYFGATKPAKWVLTGYSYQNQKEGILRCELTADNLYNCNYMAFQNTAFGSKWFFAFINSIEYINNVTSEIHFEIDVMQTYLHDVVRKPCYVEREHSSTDTPGDNLEPEPIQPGQMVMHRQWTTSGAMDKYSVVMCKASTTDGVTAGGVVCGLFTGCDYTFAEVNNQTQVDYVKQLLKLVVETNQQDAVVSLTLFPTFFCTKEAQSKVVSVKIKAPSSLGMFDGTDGYVPKNKKLFTYPYCYLVVDCGNNAATYKYELFYDRNDIKFNVAGILSNNPQIMCVPYAYDGVGNISFNYTERLVMEGFPQVAWSIDSYKAWLAQEASGVALAGIASGIAGVGGAIAQSPGAVVGGAMGVAGAINSAVLASNRPDQLKGVNTGTADVATRTKDFYFKSMTPTREHAKVIDDFFSRYGYATNRIKVPNIAVRPHWTYTKTNGCVIVGGAPADDIRKMEECYNKGITFWKNPANVGNYNLNNSI